MVVRRNIYKGLYFQRGSGIGTIFSSIFRALVPWIKKGASALIRSKPVKRLAKKAGSSALKAANTFASDIIGGQNVKKSAKVNLSQAQKDLTAALNKFNQGALNPVNQTQTRKRPHKSVNHSKIKKKYNNLLS